MIQRSHLSGNKESITLCKETNQKEQKLSKTTRKPQRNSVPKMPNLSISRLNKKSYLNLTFKHTTKTMNLIFKPQAKRLRILLIWMRMPTIMDIYIMLNPISAKDLFTQ